MADGEQATDGEAESIPPLVAPLGTRAWLKTLAAAWMAQLLSMTGFSFAMPFLPFFLRELGVGSDSSLRIWSGLVLAAPAMTMAVTAPFWGVLADRVGRRAMVMRAMFGGAVVVALMGAAPSAGALLALRFLQGAVTGTVSATNALVSSVAPAGRAGLSLGLMQTAVFAGNSLGPYLGGLSADRLGYPMTFHLAGWMLLAGGGLVAALAEEGPIRNVACARAAAPGPHGRPGLLAVLRGPGFAAAAGLVFLMHFTGMVLGPVFPFYVETLVPDHSCVNTETGRLLAVTAFTAALVALPAGWLADRVGPRPVLVFGTCLAGALVVPQGFVPALWILFVLRAALGLASGTIGPAMGSFVNRSVPRSSHGTAFGIVQSATSIGFGLGPLAGGALSAWLGLRSPFVAVGALQLAFAATAWFALDVRPDRTRAAGR